MNCFLDTLTQELSDPHLLHYQHPISVHYGRRLTGVHPHKSSQIRIYYTTNIQSQFTMVDDLLGYIHTSVLRSASTTLPTSNLSSLWQTTYWGTSTQEFSDPHLLHYQHPISVHYGRRLTGVHPHKCSQIRIYYTTNIQSQFTMVDDLLGYIHTSVLRSASTTLPTSNLSSLWQTTYWGTSTQELSDPHLLHYQHPISVHYGRRLTGVHPHKCSQIRIYYTTNIQSQFTMVDDLLGYIHTSVLRSASTTLPTSNLSSLWQTTYWGTSTQVFSDPHLLHYQHPISVHYGRRLTGVHPHKCSQIRIYYTTNIQSQFTMVDDLLGYIHTSVLRSASTTLPTSNLSSLWQTTYWGTSTQVFSDPHLLHYQHPISVHYGRRLTGVHPHKCSQIRIYYTTNIQSQFTMVDDLLGYIHTRVLRSASTTLPTSYLSSLWQTTYWGTSTQEFSDPHLLHYQHPISVHYGRRLTGVHPHKCSQIRIYYTTNIQSQFTMVDDLLGYIHTSVLRSASTTLPTSNLSSLWQTTYWGTSTQEFSDPHLLHYQHPISVHYGRRLTGVHPHKSSQIRIYYTTNILSQFTMVDDLLGYIHTRVLRSASTTLPTSNLSSLWQTTYWGTSTQVFSDPHLLHYQHPISVHYGRRLTGVHPHKCSQIRIYYTTNIQSQFTMVDDLLGYIHTRVLRSASTTLPTSNLSSLWQTTYWGTSTQVFSDPHLLHYQHPISVHYGRRLTGVHPHKCSQIHIYYTTNIQSQFTMVDDLLGYIHTSVLRSASTTLPTSYLSSLWQTTYWGTSTQELSDPHLLHYQHPILVHYGRRLTGVHPHKSSQIRIYYTTNILSQFTMVDDLLGYIHTSVLRSASTTLPTSNLSSLWQTTYWGTSTQVFSDPHLLHYQHPISVHYGRRLTGVHPHKSSQIRIYYTTNIQSQFTMVDDLLGYIHTRVLRSASTTLPTSNLSSLWQTTYWGTSTQEFSDPHLLHYQHPISVHYGRRLTGVHPHKSSQIRIYYTTNIQSQFTMVDDLLGYIHTRALRSASTTLPTSYLSSLWQTTYWGTSTQELSDPHLLHYQHPISVHYGRRLTGVHPHKSSQIRIYYTTNIQSQFTMVDDLLGYIHTRALRSASTTLPTSNLSSLWQTTYWGTSTQVFSDPHLLHYQHPISVHYGRRLTGVHPHKSSQIRIYYTTNIQSQFTMVDDLLGYIHTRVLRSASTTLPTSNLSSLWQTTYWGTSTQEFSDPHLLHYQHPISVHYGRRLTGVHPHKSSQIRIYYTTNIQSQFTMVDDLLGYIHTRVLRSASTTLPTSNLSSLWQTTYWGTSTQELSDPHLLHYQHPILVHYGRRLTGVHPHKCSQIRIYYTTNIQSQFTMVDDLLGYIHTRVLRSASTTLPTSNLSSLWQTTYWGTSTQVFSDPHLLHYQHPISVHYGRRLTGVHPHKCSQIRIYYTTNIQSQFTMVDDLLGYIHTSVLRSASTTLPTSNLSSLWQTTYWGTSTQVFSDPHLLHYQHPISVHYGRRLTGVHPHKSSQIRIYYTTNIQSQFTMVDDLLGYIHTRVLRSASTTLPTSNLSSLWQTTYWGTSTQVFSDPHLLHYQHPISVHYGRRLTGVHPHKCSQIRIYYTTNIQSQFTMVDDLLGYIHTSVLRSASTTLPTSNLSSLWQTTYWGTSTQVFSDPHLLHYQHPISVHYGRRLTGVHPHKSSQIRIYYTTNIQSQFTMVDDLLGYIHTRVLRSASTTLPTSNLSSLWQTTYWGTSTQVFSDPHLLHYQHPILVHYGRRLTGVHPHKCSQIRIYYTTNIQSQFTMVDDLLGYIHTRVLRSASTTLPTSNLSSLWQTTYWGTSTQEFSDPHLLHYQHPISVHYGRRLTGVHPHKCSQIRIYYTTNILSQFTMVDDLLRYICSGYLECFTQP